jgi:D-lyxose ketol-isomerase
MPREKRELNHIAHDFEFDRTNEFEMTKFGQNYVPAAGFFFFFIVEEDAALMYYCISLGN